MEAGDLLVADLDLPDAFEVDPAGPKPTSGGDRPRVPLRTQARSSPPMSPAAIARPRRTHGSLWPPSQGRPASGKMAESEITTSGSGPTKAVIVADIETEGTRDVDWSPLIAPPTLESGWQALARGRMRAERSQSTDGN